MLTKDEIRKIAIEYLTYRGFDCWINNTRAEPGRRFIGRKGVPDIAGINKNTGVAMYCEVKAGKDVLSLDQYIFLTRLTIYGGWALMAVEKAGRAEVIGFSTYLDENKNQIDNLLKKSKK